MSLVSITIHGDWLFKDNVLVVWNVGCTPNKMKEKNTINNFIIQTPRYIPSGTFGFWIKILENVPEEFRTLRAQKKRGTFSPSLDALRSSTTYYLPITTSKAHAGWRERRRFTLGDILKVSKFQSIQCTSYFAFSYSMVCITALCGSDHRRFVSLLFIVLSKISGAKVLKILLY